MFNRDVLLDDLVLVVHETEKMGVFRMFQRDGVLSFSRV